MCFQVVALAKQLDMTERQVERWWRMRRSQDKPSTLVKFCENAWRCTYYTFSTILGVFVLSDKEWLWDIDHCYINYPHQVCEFVDCTDWFFVFGIKMVCVFRVTLTIYGGIIWYRCPFIGRWLFPNSSMWNGKIFGRCLFIILRRSCWWVSAGQPIYIGLVHWCYSFMTVQIYSSR